MHHILYIFIMFSVSLLYNYFPICLIAEIPMGTTPLDLISVEDIGEVARTVFLDESRFLNKTLSLCGSKPTISEMAHYLTQYLRPLQFKDKPVRNE